MTSNPATAPGPHEPYDLKKVQAIIQDITIQGTNLENGTAGSRDALLTQALTLVATLDSPVENIYSFILAEPSRMFASRMALDLKFFQTLAADSGRPKSVNELAAPQNASPQLVRRLIRHLAAMKMVEQTGDDEYAQNRISKFLASAIYREGFCYAFDAIGPSLSKMPEYFAQTGYTNPSDTNDGPFQYAHKTPSHWAWIEERPRVMQAFHDYLTGVRQDRPNFMDQGFYPVESRLITGLNLDSDSDSATIGDKLSSASAFVDVGGGTGHALAELKTKVPAWKGRLVLQEQESVVRLAQSEPHASVIEAHVHDFFTAQPLKGARAYYLRYILHDWPDEECRVVLRHLREAMTPEYSKILIHEYVIADRDASWQHTALDLTMMALFATQERTESEWRALIESVGMRISGIWSMGRSDLSVIEVTL